MIKIIDKFRKNRLLFILGILIILTLLLLIFRISYAFLTSSVNSAQGSIVVDSDDTDNLSFSVGNPLSINATPTTLPENGANLTSSTTASATLIANTTNSTAEANYYVYFSISNNTFIYSDGSTPEIILTVTGPDGEITNIDGLTYGTFSGVSGFDVTIQNGTFGVAIPTTITTNSSTTGTTQNWTFTLTYLNLPSDQSANYGNSMTTEVMIQKRAQMPTLANYIINDIYTEDGVNGLYYHDGVGTYTNANQEAGDKSYRYSGANPNNYVCFGSDAATCPEENLYRIIGLFDDDNDEIYNLKLIKSTRYGRYAWDSGNSNTWSATTKPDVYTTLNTTYWNTLSNEWQNRIDETHKWQVGGMARITTNTAKQYYEVEIKNQTGYEETMAIGLMYVSDYGYAASPENWQTALYDYYNTTNTNNNWMYLGANEWTISRRSGNPYHVFYVLNTGRVDYIDATNAPAVRPSFYLKSEIALEGGTGSASDPYRINL